MTPTLSYLDERNSYYNSFQNYKINTNEEIINQIAKDHINTNNTQLFRSNATENVYASIIASLIND